MGWLATLLTGSNLTVVAGVVGLAFGGLSMGVVGYKSGHALGYRSGYSDGYKTGVAAMAAEVERRNAAAAETARRAKGTVDQCWDRGGSWDQSDGVCRD